MPSTAHSAIRYLHIPAADVDASSAFDARALGWTIRRRADGSTTFDDACGHVSGEWVLDRGPAGDAGVLVFARVDDVDSTLRAVTEAGGTIIAPPTRQGKDIVYATFRDPGDNVVGIFQETRA